MLEVTAVAVLAVTAISFAAGWLFDEKDMLGTLGAESWSTLWRGTSTRNRRACIVALVLTTASIILAVVLAVAVLASGCPGGDC